MTKAECKYCGKKFDDDKALEMHVNSKHSNKIIKVFKPKKYALIITVSLILVAILIFFAFQYSENVGPLGSTHKHYDLRIYIDGNVDNLADRKYWLKSQFIHAEDNLQVVHKHAINVTLGFFLKTIGIELNDKCIKFEGKSYCEKENYILKIFYRKPNSNSWEKVERNIYKFEAFDRWQVLLYYGLNDQKIIDEQKSLVTNNPWKA